MDQPSEYKKKHAHLTQILQSPEFHDSTRYQELLQYLVDKSSKVTSLKETEIAHDVFGKNSSFDPAADPLIRSYISNLRKKLEHYYLTTTDQYDYKLEIPKGQYLVKYTKVSQNIIPKKMRTYLPEVYLGTIGILICVILLQFFRGSSAETAESRADNTNPFWSEYLNNDQHPTLIVLGDFLVLSEKGVRHLRTFLRDPRVNNEKELLTANQQNNNKYGKYQISDVTYLGTSTGLGLSEVMKVLKTSTKPITVKLSSQLKWDDFENNNIIYVGTLKTLAKLDTLFSRTNLRYHLFPNTLSITGPHNDSVRTLNLNWHGGNYQKDYSVVLKYQSSKNNSIIFLTGFSELGVMESIKASTDSNLISRINAFTHSEIKQRPLFFELISETEGVGYTIFRSDIRYFLPLEERTNK
jgi:hypothetical protein